MADNIQWVFIETKINSYGGHNYNYLKSLTDLVEDKVAYIPYNSTLNEPFFRKFLSPYHLPHLKWKPLSKLISFIYQLNFSVKRYKELKKIFCEIQATNRTTIVVWPTIDDCELISFLYIHVPKSVRLFGVEHSVLHSLYAKIVIRFLKIFNLLVTQQKVIGYNSEVIMSYYQSIGINVKGNVIPYPFNKVYHCNEGSICNQYISFLGDARNEKGFSLILDCLDDIVKRGSVFIQCNIIADDRDLQKKLYQVKTQYTNKDLVVWQESEVSFDDYYDNLRIAKLILLPYEPDCYQGRVSGILGEALIYGVPVVVSPNTWLSEQVEKYGGGVIMDEYSTNGLIGAIDKVIQNVEFYREQARKAGAQFFEANNPAKLLKSIKKSCLE